MPNVYKLGNHACVLHFDLYPKSHCVKCLTVYYRKEQKDDKQLELFGPVSN